MASRNCPKGLVTSMWPSAILAGWRVTSAVPVFASSILMGRWDNFQTRPSALGMSDPIWGPLIHIFVDEKKN